jgi:Rrf2 family protein
MKLITRDTDYAMRALMYMAKRPERVVSVKELVGELEIPRAFLRRLLQVLSQKKILKSMKGKGGGFRLNRPPRKIGVADIMKIFQGNTDIIDCMFKKAICPDIGRCPLRREIKKIEKDVQRELDRITISSLTQGF